MPCFERRVERPQGRPSRFRNWWPRTTRGSASIRAELTGQHVELRFDPVRDNVLPRVFVSNRFVCDTVPLDRLGNAHRVRRRDVGAPAMAPQPSGLHPLALIQAEHQLYTRPLSGALSPEDVARFTSAVKPRDQRGTNPRDQCEPVQVLLPPARAG